MGKNAVNLKHRRI